MRAHDAVLAAAHQLAGPDRRVRRSAIVDATPALTDAARNAAFTGLVADLIRLHNGLYQLPG